MSRRDAGLIFSQAQSITALSTPSTNYIDFFDNSHQIGQAVKVPYLHVKVNQTFVGLSTLGIYFQDAPPAAGSTGPNAIPGTWEGVGFLAAIPLAALFAGNDLINVSIPMTGGIVGLLQVPFQPFDSLSDSPLQRFIRFLYTPDVIPTAGSIDAWLDVL